MYRAVSQAIYGTEDHQMMIRLNTALEMLANPDFYDVDSPQCKDLIGDYRIEIIRWEKITYRDKDKKKVASDQSGAVFLIFYCSLQLTKHGPPIVGMFDVWFY